MTFDSRMGDVSIHRVTEATSWKKTLQAQLDALQRSGMTHRPWLYWEWHNPFSRAAGVIDSWQILDICQAPALMTHLTEKLGPDIVLFDSQIVPNPVLRISKDPSWPSGGTFFPLREQRGAVVRLPLGIPSDRQTCGGSGSSQRLDTQPEDIVIHGPALDHRDLATASDYGLEFVIRYFPADLQFIRDPAHPIQDRLTRRFPWVNYATMPLWLVCGQDRADNDFVTGLLKRSGRWTTARAAD